MPASRSTRRPGRRPGPRVSALLLAPTARARREHRPRHHRGVRRGRQRRRRPTTPTSSSSTTPPAPTSAADGKSRPVPLRDRHRRRPTASRRSPARSPPASTTWSRPAPPAPTAPRSRRPTPSSPASTWRRGSGTVFLANATTGLTLATAIGRRQRRAWSTWSASATTNTLRDRRPPPTLVDHDVGPAAPTGRRHRQQRRRLHRRRARRRRAARLRRGAAAGRPVDATIAEIQGTDTGTSPHVGDIVTAQGVVTASYPDRRLQRLLHPDRGHRRRPTPRRAPRTRSSCSAARHRRRYPAASATPSR